MSMQTLSSVAIDVVGQYNAAGTHLAQAYRAGVSRVIEQVGSRYSAFVHSRSLPFVSEGVKANLIDAQQTLAGLVVKGVNAGSDRTVQAIDSVAARATSGISAIANTTARIETAFNVSPSTVETVRKLNMPAAHIALQVAEKIAEGAKAVEARVAARDEQGSVLVLGHRPSHRRGCGRDRRRAGQAGAPQREPGRLIAPAGSVR